MNAVNMDSGYVNYLSETGKRDVERWTREDLGKDVPFVSGAYIEGQSGDAVPLYRREMEVISSAGGIPILPRRASFTENRGRRRRRSIKRVCRGYPQVLSFELGKMFAPNGEVFDQETFRRLKAQPAD